MNMKTENNSNKNNVIHRNKKEEIIKTKNGFSYEKNGWKYISIHGDPYERGFSYGYLCAKEFKEIQEMLDWYIFESYGNEWKYFIEQINKTIYNKTKTDFYELFLEMKGISDGCNANGTKTNIEEIIAWNFYMSIPSWLKILTGTAESKEGGSQSEKTNDHCSCFIAVGDYTENGEIVIGHNSFTTFLDGQFSNVILDLNPTTGFRFIMQTSPCWIWSGTDFFITTAGIIGSETTIGGFLNYEPNYPIGYRIRTAMQYGSDLDDYAKILLYNNSGDYANSWLFGDTKTNEIMRLELGLKHYNIAKTKNGYFIGYNAPLDPRIRNLEVKNSGFYDIRRHQGSRRVRLTELMEENKGKINITVAKKIMSDHYDVYLKKDNNPCSRTVCSHYDLDMREYMSQSDRPKPYSPQGAVDGKVTDTKLIKNMSFIARFGNSCGIPFDKDKFCSQHIQYANFCKYLKDRPRQDWTLFSSDQYKNSNNSLNIKINKKYVKNLPIMKGYKLHMLDKKNNVVKYIDNVPFEIEYYEISNDYTLKKNTNKNNYKLNNKKHTINKTKYLNKTKKNKKT